VAAQYSPTCFCSSLSPLTRVSPLENCAHSHLASFRFVVTMTTLTATIDNKCVFNILIAVYIMCFHYSDSGLDLRMLHFFFAPDLEAALENSCCRRFKMKHEYIIHAQNTPLLPDLHLPP
jgi:hypothetical protein